MDDTFDHVLVTGAAGFIGSHLSRRLLEDGRRVTGIDNLNAYYDVSLKTGRLEQLNGSKSFSFEKIDLSDLEAMKGLFERSSFDCVVNLAAQAGVRYSIENPHAYVEANLVGFVNVLECCRHNDIRHEGRFPPG